MTLDQLIEMLEDIRDTRSGDRPVYMAIQPSYPLALEIHGVTDGQETELELHDNPEVSESIWLVASDRHPQEIVYAFQSFWDAAQRP